MVTVSAQSGTVSSAVSGDPPWILTLCTMDFVVNECVPLFSKKKRKISKLSKIIFQPIPVFSSQFKLSLAHSCQFQHIQPIPAYSSIFQPIPANCSQVQHITDHFSLLQHIPAYFSLFQPLRAYAILFQAIPAHSSLLQSI